MFRTCLLFIVIALILPGCTDSELEYPTRKMPSDIVSDLQSLAWAKETFLRKCAYCHGHEYEGRGSRADFFDPPAPDFSEQRYRRIDPAYV